MVDSDFYIEGSIIQIPETTDAHFVARMPAARRPLNRIVVKKSETWGPIRAMAAADGETAKSPANEALGAGLVRPSLVQCVNWRPLHK
jgi:hypothetical protein